MNKADKVFSALKYPVFYDSEGQKVMDADNKMVVDIRGWGWIQKLDKDNDVCEELQDALGEEIASLINYRIKGADVHYGGIVIPSLMTDKNKIISRAMTFISEEADEFPLAKEIFNELGTLLDRK